MEFLPLARFRQQMDVNVTGQVAVTHAFMPLVRKGRGRVVFMGSIGGRLATPFLGPYNASKFALEAITDAMRVELKPWNIHVSIIEPGSIATPIWEKSLSMADEIESEVEPEAMKLYQKQVDAMRKTATTIGGRGIPPDEVAKAVEHALMAKTPKTRYIVGRDARMQALLMKFLPDRLRDRAISRFLGLPSKP
jgi:NAD(P)-dependent dehydrogenase (short-subunit alcohol dehydrogenase family)